MNQTLKNSLYLTKLAKFPLLSICPHIPPFSPVFVKTRYGSGSLSKEKFRCFLIRDPFFFCSYFDTPDPKKDLKSETMLDGKVRVSRSVIPISPNVSLEELFLRAKACTAQLCSRALKKEKKGVSPIFFAVSPQRATSPVELFRSSPARPFWFCPASPT